MSGKTVIDVLLADHPFPGFLDPVRRRAAEFCRAHPEYDINIQTYHYWTSRDDFYRIMDRGSAPDLVDYFFTETQRARDAMAADGSPLFTPIESAIAGRTEILGEPVVISDLVDAARTYYSYDGELVSQPFSTSTALLYTNTGLLEAAGVSEIPRTWADVEAACRAVAGLGRGPSHGVTWANDGWFFQHVVCEQGGLLADHDNGRSGRATSVDLASDEMLAWVTWWQRLHQDGVYLHTGTASDWIGTFDAFERQEVPFLYNSSVMADKIVSAGAAAGFRVAVSPLPHNGDVPYAGATVGGDSIWLAAGLDGRKQDGALAFLQYLLKPANAAEWHKSSGFIPITRTSHRLLESEGWFRDRPHQRVATEQLDASDGSPAGQGALVGDLAGMHDDLVAAMADVLDKGADPRERFRQASDAAQRRLETYDARRAGAKWRAARPGTV